MAVLHLRSEWVPNDREEYKLRSAFDLTHGYVFTVHMVQGATLETGIIVFENVAPPGWGYTAVTRFRSREGLRCSGDVTAQRVEPRTL